jgi:ribulose 1,5-bisphosphate synthetase/thiazole synthase
MIDQKIVTRAIIERYTSKLLSRLELDVAICRSGPSGLVAAYYLAKAREKVAELVAER